MLQWTGGSRRKVNATRKSTYNRQRQYFEQKKRKQQPPFLDTSANVKNKRILHTEGARSADILSLTDLATFSSQHCTGADILQAIPNVPKHCGDSERKRADVLQAIPDVPKRCGDPERTRTPSNSERLAQLQNKLVADNKQVAQNHADKIGTKETSSNDRKSLNGSAETEDEMNKNLSLFDLLSDDGSHNNQGGRSSHEDHVAFSVEGLGKIRTETPVHSPRHTVRVSFGASCSPAKASRWMGTSDNLNFMSHDMGPELDLDASLGSLPSKLRDTSHIISHLDDAARSNIDDVDPLPFDDSSNLTDKIFNRKKSMYKPTSHMNGTQTDGYSMLYVNFVDEERNDASWKNMFSKELNNATSFEEVKTSQVRYDYDDFYPESQRSKVEVQKSFKKGDSHASCFDDLLLERNQSPTFSDQEGYPFPNHAFHFENVQSPAWSFLPEKDAVDSRNILSDELSCSTSGGHQVNDNSWPEQEHVDGIDSFCRKKKHRRLGMEYDVKNLFSDNVKFEDLNNIRGKGLPGEENHRSFQSRRKNVHNSYSEGTPVIKKISETYRWCFFEEGHSLADLVPNPLPKSSRENKTYFDHNSSMDCPYLFDSWTRHPCKSSVQKTQVTHDKSGQFHFRSHSGRQKSVPAKSTKIPSCCAFKNVDQTPSPFYSEGYQWYKFPDSSKPLKNGEDVDVERGFLMATGRETYQEAHEKSSVEDNGSTSKTAAVSVAADDCGKQEVGHESPDTYKSPEAEESPQSVDTPVVMEDAPGMQKFVINNMLSNIQASAADSPGRSGRKVKKNLESDNQNPKKHKSGTADSSYQVMLESYVLQLLCVQKVLLDSSANDTVKKT